MPKVSRWTTMHSIGKSIWLEIIFDHYLNASLYCISAIANQQTSWFSNQKSISNNNLIFTAPPSSIFKITKCQGAEGSRGSTSASPSPCQISLRSVKPLMRYIHAPKIGVLPKSGELGLSPYQLASWSIQAFGHNRRRPGFIWTQPCLRPSVNRESGGGFCAPFHGRTGSPTNTMSPGPRPISVPSCILIHLTVSSQ